MVLCTLVIVFGFSVTKASAATVVPMMTTHYETFTVTKPDSKKWDLIVKPYGSIFSKNVGTLTCNYNTTWKATWLCDQYGNKISEVSITTPTFVTSSVRRTFLLKLYATVSETHYDISTSQIRLSGIITYSPLGQISSSASYNQVITPVVS